MKVCFTNEKNNFRLISLLLIYLSANINQLASAKQYPYTNEIKFIKIFSGEFNKGSPATEPGRYGEDQFKVILSSDFEILSTEVTQWQWYQLMGSNPSQFKYLNHCPNAHLNFGESSLCPNNPVENITWYEAQRFIEKLNLMDKSYTYFLPTEAQWEYAARATTSTAFSFGEKVDELFKHAWFSENSNNQTQQVATRIPNLWGLYDMHGNVFEWVSDWYRYSSPGSPQIDPSGPQAGSDKVIKGGSWYSYPLLQRSAARNYYHPLSRAPYIGFRVARKLIK